MNYRTWSNGRNISGPRSVFCLHVLTTEMAVITLEKNVEPQVAFGLIYLQLLCLIQSMEISLCIVYTLPFLLGNSFPPPSTWKAPSCLSEMSSDSISEVSSKLCCTNLDFSSTLNTPERNACLCESWLFHYTIQYIV